MANQGTNNIRLGVFVIAGLFLLIFSFYLIGKNHNLFGSDFRIRVRFSNLNGLTEGNNVLFSGIQAGTVKNIEMINDTTIEVSLLISSRIRPFIRQNAVASVGTEGLMGNKIVNIVPARSPAPTVMEGTLLAAQKNISTDELLQTLSRTNNNVALISEELKKTVIKINNSSLLDILNDKQAGQNIRLSLSGIHRASANAANLTKGLDDLVKDIRDGKGAAGLLLTDTAAQRDLRITISKIKEAGNNAGQLTSQLDKLVKNMNERLNQNNGSLHVLLNDTAFARNLSTTMDNLQKGTDGFNQNMEALKHNFLFRGYFKSLEKKKKKEAAH